MKNMKKLAAGFIAAAMAMTMSLSAFADVVVPSISTDKATLTININNAEEAQMTMMAYVVEGTEWTTETAPAYSNQEIVALDQEAGSNGFTTVPVDATKLADGKSIIVKIGATSGTLATYVIKMERKIVTYSVTYELAGGTVTNAGANTFAETDTIAAFFADLEAPLKAATSTATYTFAGWSKTDGGEAIDTTSAALMTTLLDEGATSITLYALYTETPIATDKTYYLGDIDGNGVVENDDIVEFIVYGKTGTSAYGIGQTLGNTSFVLGDIDGNGVVENDDIVEFIVYGKTGTSVYAIGQPLKK